jgi:nucleoside-diphosphate-sugar epimerase
MTLNICITGAAGQVGKLVSRAALAKGHKVLGIDLPDNSGISASQYYAYKKLDVRKHEDVVRAMEEGKCDAVIHLAAILNNPNRLVKGKEWTEDVSLRLWVGW